MKKSRFTDSQIMAVGFYPVNTDTSKKCERLRDLFLDDRF